MVCVMTSAPLSNGVTHAFSKAVQIGGVLEAVTEEYDLKQDYDGKHIAKGKGAIARWNLEEAGGKSLA